MTWLYQDKEFTPKDIGDYNGFIYCITEVETGMKYIGQKVFWNKVVKKPLKGKTRKRHSKKPSDWQTYYGSSDELKEQVNISGNEYKREILRLCKTKSEMNYMEAKEIFIRDALLRDDYYNKWISTRINASTLSEIQLRNGS